MLRQVYTDCCLELKGSRLEVNVDETDRRLGFSEPRAKMRSPRQIVLSGHSQNSEVRKKGYSKLEEDLKTSKD